MTFCVVVVAVCYFGLSIGMHTIVVVSKRTGRNYREKRSMWSLIGVWLLLLVVGRKTASDNAFWALRFSYTAIGCVAYLRFELFARSRYYLRVTAISLRPKNPDIRFINEQQAIALNESIARLSTAAIIDDTKRTIVTCPTDGTPMTIVINALSRYGHGESVSKIVFNLAELAGNEYGSPLIITKWSFILIKYHEKCVHEMEIKQQKDFNLSWLVWRRSQLDSPAHQITRIGYVFCIWLRFNVLVWIYWFWTQNFWLFVDRCALECGIAIAPSEKIVLEIGWWYSIGDAQPVREHDESVAGYIRNCRPLWIAPFASMRSFDDVGDDETIDHQVALFADGSRIGLMIHIQNCQRTVVGECPGWWFATSTHTHSHTNISRTRE